MANSKVQVVGQQGSPAERYRDEMAKIAISGFQKPSSPDLPDGFQGDNQTVSSGGIFGWRQNRAYDPRAFQVQHLDQHVGDAATNSLDAARRPGAQIATGPQDQARAQQMGLAGLLTRQANGVGPSIAQNQLQQGTDANIRQAMALGASQRGVGAGAALRGIAQNSAQIQQQSVADAGLLRLQEQQQAQNQLGQVLSGTRGQDQSLAASQAQLDQGQMAENDKMVQFFQNQGLSLEEAQRQAYLQREQMGVQYDLGLRGVAINSQGQAGQTVGAGIGAAGALMALAASDERLKTDIKPGGGELMDFLDAVGSHAYRYKDERHGKGEFFSPMAQELEKSKVGKSMVIETPAGKMVDYGRGLGALLSSVATIHKRLKAVEGKGVVYE